MTVYRHSESTYYPNDQRYEAVSETPFSETPDEDTSYPLAYLEAVPRRGKFIANFSNEGSEYDPKNKLGLSQDYLLHQLKQIHNRSSLDEDGGRLSRDEKGFMRTLHRTSGGMSLDPYGYDEEEDDTVSSAPVSNKYLKRQMNKNKLVNPDTLFTEVTSPHLLVQDMFSDPSMRHHVPTLAMVAHIRNGRLPLMPSESLSRHSSKIVQNAMGRGTFPIIKNPMNTRAVQTNMMEMDDVGTIEPPSEEDQLIPTHELQMARHMLRESLRGGKTRNATPITGTTLSDQMLPGMEKYM